MRWPWRRSKPTPPYNGPRTVVVKLEVEGRHLSTWVLDGELYQAREGVMTIVCPWSLGPHQLAYSPPDYRPEGWEA